MTPKSEEKQSAIKMRLNGESVSAIARKLKVSRGSVSTWVRHIPLTEDQRKALVSRRGVIQNQNFFNRSDKFRKTRLDKRRDGILKSKEKDWRHAFACALYYGEGSKGQNSVVFTNTDVVMLRFFVDFIKDYFNVCSSNFRLLVSCYLDGRLSIDEIKKYWSDHLDIPVECFTKSTIREGKPYVDKHPYGVCRVTICDTNILQHILGAIKGYVNDNSNKWET